VKRLPLAPPLHPEEALSSWIARLAARYDLSADNLVRHLLPNEPSLGGIARWIDDRPYPQLEAALAEAAGQPGMDFTACRLPGLAANPAASWSRAQPCWCPVCLYEDVAAHGEVYARRSWGMGAYLLCTIHGCLLVSECPRCFDRISNRPVNGRLRLWCNRCDDVADNVLEPSRVPFWPFGLPQQRRRCRTVHLTDEARQLLLRLQRTRLSALMGRQVRAPWTRQLRRNRVTETLRRLCFIMLGPLWEDNGRPQLVQPEGGDTWQLPADWTPGLLPPFIAAPALLASVTFLAAEAGQPLAGVTWDRQALLDGEKAEIDAETLPWHLNAADAVLAQALLSPGDEPFGLLLSALRCDRTGLATTREARRRQYGIGSLQRRRRLTEAAHRTESDWSRDARERRERSYPPSDRYAIARLMPGIRANPASPAARTSWKAVVAVFATFGANDDDDDVVHRTGWTGTRMEGRYVQSWIVQHRDCGARDLIAALEKAVDRARAEDRGLVLPDLAPRPITAPWTDAAAP